MVKNKLWVFGDSFNAVYRTEEFGKQYIDYLGYEPPTFSEIIAKQSDLELVNMAMGGSDNYSILETLCENSDKIGDDDYIIVGWTDHARYRVVYDKKWRNFLSSPTIPQDTDDFLYINQNVISEIAVKRLNNKFVLSEVCNWTKLLKKMYRSKILFWTWHIPYPCNYIIHPNNYLPKVMNMGITIDTKGEIIDGHLNKDGHVLLAELFYETLFTVKTII